MMLRRLFTTKEISQSEKIARMLGLSLLAFTLVIAGNIACKKAEEGEVASEAESTIKEGLNKFEGMVKTGVGRYFFIPEVRGLDIVIQGQTELGDASALEGKKIRGEGEFSPERPSILIANSIEVIESDRNWRNVFTRTEEFVIDDYLDLKEREEFQLLEGLSFDKNQTWEGKEKGKVVGKLEKETVTEGGEQKETYRIVVLDENGEEMGKIIVDNLSDFALYYQKKLSFFDSFYFYITIKDTVDWDVRKRTHELFHAGVNFAGLF